MSDIYRQTPGELDLELVRGEPFTMSFTVDRNLAGYTHYAAIRLAGGGDVPFSVTCVDGLPSTLGVTLTDEQSTALPLGLRRWYYRWVHPVSGERTVLAGEVKIVSPT